MRRRVQSATVVTPYHLHAAGEHLGLAEADVRECLRELGGVVWEGDAVDGDDDDEVCGIVTVDDTDGFGRAYCGMGWLRWRRRMMMTMMVVVVGFDGRVCVQAR